MENKPGNAYTSPFGDEQGATVAGGGPSTGSHDYTKDPASQAAATGGKDFTKESYPQKAGSDQECVDQGSTAKTPWVFSDMDKSGPGVDGVSPPVPFKNLKG